MTDEKTHKKMTAFARTFPSMRHALGIDPWDAEELASWSKGPLSHGERVTAWFLLSVWDPVVAWDLDPFDLMEALRIWDPAHHQAFLRWAAKPWWP
jgi:hypothetical protein